MHSPATYWAFFKNRRLPCWLSAEKEAVSRDNNLHTTMLTTIIAMQYCFVLPPQPKSVLQTATHHTTHLLQQMDTAAVSSRAKMMRARRSTHRNWVYVLNSFTIGKAGLVLNILMKSACMVHLMSEKEGVHTESQWGRVAGLMKSPEKAK